MQDLFDRFIKEKTYLKGVAPNTTNFYIDSFRAFQLHRGEISVQGIKTFVINM